MGLKELFARLGQLAEPDAPALVRAQGVLSEMCGALVTAHELSATERARELKKPSSQRYAARVGDVTALAARTVGLAGTEGAGKSTLANAIFGMAITPVDSEVAGTVAPVFVRYADTETPRYSVRYARAPEKDSACADAEAFEKLILQRHNARNAKGVSKGVIELKAEHLAPGFALVDLPGLGGVDTQFREVAEAALGEIDGAILVSMNRSVQKAIDVARVIIEAGQVVDAFVVNLAQDRFFDGETEELISEEAAQAQIDQIKAFAREALRANGVTLPEDRVFAFHAPSMRRLTVRATARLRLACHDAEIARFRAWFSGRYGRGGAIDGLAEGLKRAQTLLTEQSAALDRDEAFLNAILHEDSDQLAAVKRDVEAYRSAVKRRFAAALKQADASKVKRQHRDAVLTKVKSQKEWLRSWITRMQAKNEALSWSEQDWSTTKKTCALLNNKLNLHAEKIATAEKKAREEYRAFCCDVAEEIIAREERALMPILIKDQEIGSVSARKLWKPPKLDPTPINLGEHLDSSYILRRLFEEATAAELKIDAAETGEIAKKHTGGLEYIEKKRSEILVERARRLTKILSGGASSEVEAAQKRIRERRRHLEAAASAAQRCAQALELAQAENAAFLAHNAEAPVEAAPRPVETAREDVGAGAPASPPSLRRLLGRLLSRGA